MEISFLLFQSHQASSNLYFHPYKGTKYGEFSFDLHLIDDEFLFTGDALRLKSGEIRTFLRFISSDYEKMRKTIEMLAELGNISILFTAHTGFTTNFYKAIEKWKKLKKKD